MKSAIVTGGAGFIGSALARRLITNGWSVEVIDDLSSGFQRNIPQEAIFHQIDVSNSKDLHNIRTASQVDAIFHFASQVSGEASFEDPSRDLAVNLNGTYNILQYSKSIGCPRFLFSSSMSVYGEVPSDHGPVKETDSTIPKSYYGCHKLASENVIRIFCENHGITFTSFRLFNVFGPGQNLNNMRQGMVSIYVSYLLNNHPIPVKGSIDRFRDLIFIDDVIEGFIRCLDRSSSYNKVLNLGTGKKTRVEILLNFLLKTFGKVSFEDWVRVEGNTPGDVMGCYADTSLLQECLSWSPERSMEEGISHMHDWALKTKELWTGLETGMP